MYDHRAAAGLSPRLCLIRNQPGLHANPKSRTRSGSAWPQPSTLHLNLQDGLNYYFEPYTTTSWGHRQPCTLKQTMEGIFTLTQTSTDWRLWPPMPNRRSPITLAGFGKSMEAAQQYANRSSGLQIIVQNSCKSITSENRSNSRPLHQLQATFLHPQIDGTTDQQDANRSKARHQLQVTANFR
jgi:hypothetical protein